MARAALAMLRWRSGSAWRRPAGCGRIAAPLLLEVSGRVGGHCCSVVCDSLTAKAPWGAPTRPHAAIPPTDLTVSHIREFSARTWKTRRRRGTWSEGPKSHSLESFFATTGDICHSSINGMFPSPMEPGRRFNGRGAIGPGRIRVNAKFGAISSIWRNQFNKVGRNAVRYRRSGRRRPSGDLGRFGAGRTVTAWSRRRS